MTTHLSALQAIDPSVKIHESRIYLESTEDDGFKSVGDFHVGDSEVTAYTFFRNYLEINFSVFLLIRQNKVTEKWAQEMAAILSLPLVELRDEPGPLATFTVNGKDYEVLDVSSTNLALIEQSLKGPTALTFADSMRFEYLQEALAEAFMPGNTISINGGPEFAPDRHTRVLIDVMADSEALELDRSAHCARVLLPAVNQEFILDGSDYPQMFKELDLTPTVGFASKVERAVETMLRLAAMPNMTPTERPEGMVEDIAKKNVALVESAIQIAMVAKHTEPDSSDEAAADFGATLAMFTTIQAWIGDKFAVEYLLHGLFALRALSKCNYSIGDTRNLLGKGFYEGATGTLTKDLLQR